MRLAVLDAEVPAPTRARCIQRLADDVGSIPILKLAGADPARMVRNAAQAALIRLGDKVDRFARVEMKREQIDTLLLRLDDPESSDRDKARACALLALVKEPRAGPALRRLCRAVYPDFLRLEAVRALVHITGKTHGFRPGQPAREREAVLRRWADG